ncbi:hypothetical protein B0H19DRAFT_1273022 [Mycena capillaripes]|nr:hypothetical protein B0H19DRAFT_1273022 [Mycena capillaripes]
MTHPNFLANSRTLIIGGSSGLGFAVASGALSSGAKVHITSITSTKLSSKIAQLQSLYPNAHVSGSSADLSRPETLEANLHAILDAAVEATGGALDHIVYTAGEFVVGVPLAEATAATALAPFTVRYLGPLLLAKLVAAHAGHYLAPTHTSSLTLTSGMLAHRPLPGLSAVLGMTGAVEVLGRALAVDLAPIRVNVVIAGRVETEMLQKVTGGNNEMFRKASLTNEVGTAEGAAEAYLFCMRSTLATGQGFKCPCGKSFRCCPTWAFDPPARCGGASAPVHKDAGLHSRVYLPARTPERIRCARAGEASPTAAPTAHLAWRWRVDPQRLISAGAVSWGPTNTRDGLSLARTAARSRRVISGAGDELQLVPNGAACRRPTGATDCGADSTAGCSGISRGVIDPVSSRRGTRYYRDAWTSPRT